MKISQLIFLFLLACLCQPQPVCYASCSQGGCLPNNSQICTKCDTGTILLNNRCTSSGSQSQPIRILQPNAANTLDINGLPLFFSNRSQVKCKANTGQPNEITYLNLFLNAQQVYTVRIPQQLINSPHQYINLKFNAILFNQKNNPKSQIRVLMIDGQTDKKIYDNPITSNEKEMVCDQGRISFNKAFFVSVNTSSSSQSLLISITTITPGDQLGLSDINIYYGNCFMGCASCEGPGSNQCLSCQNLLVYDPNSKTCSTCPKTFYKVNELCLECPYNCYTCQFSQKQGGPVCLKCQDDITGKNVTAPLCPMNNYVNESLKQLIFDKDNGWKSSATTNSITTLCGSYSLVGGLSGFGGFGISKTFYNLPVHKKIWIKFTFFLIDQIPGSNYRDYITVDGVPARQNSTIYLESNEMSTNECGLQKKQFVTSVFIHNISHTSDNATISIMGQSNYFGIRDFVLGVVNLTDISNCDQVGPNNACIRCQNGYQLVNPNKPDQKCTVCPNGTYLQKDRCVVCPIYCNTCLNIGPNSTRCGSCDPPLIFDVASGTCNDKNSNLYTAALSQNWNKSVTSRQWNFIPKLQNKGIEKCGPYSILGSTTIKYRTLTMSRFFERLPAHQGVYLHFYLYQIDNYDAANLKSLQFKLDNQEIPYNLSTNGYDICGNSSYDSIQKVTLFSPTHRAENLNFSIVGNSKFGISNLLVFLANCQQCKKYGISYELQTIPLYSAASNPNPKEKGLKSKIIFDQKVYINGDNKDLFNVKLIDKNSTEYQSLKTYLLSQTSNGTFDERNPNGFFGRGQKDPYAITDSQFYANRQLILYQNLINNQRDKDAVAVLLSPDSAYGYKNNDQNLLQSLRLQPVLGQFARYDDIYSVIDTQSESGQRYRANTRNLMNLFRGISILALFIGLVSFFFNISEIFDDLFLLCQLIFVHIFIQSPWISATMKLPVGAMNLVQFMAWLPLEGRESLEKAIIPPNHYQRSPIVYEQYWRDITFARTIYHTVIFLAAMLIFFWLIRLIKSIRQPSISKVMDVTHRKYHFVENYFYNHASRWFVFIDKVMRFTFFTVMWASCLQFIHFYNEPNGFFGWNSTLCIVMFVCYVLYVFLGYFYLRRQAGISQISTFRQKFGGIRIKKDRLLYFIFKYLKLLAIAFIIGQLYKANPLAVLIPLIFIHLLDAAILIIFKPYLEDLREEDHHIVSKCAQNYWSFYRISHIIENFLFVILQVIMIIMYAVRGQDNKYNYLQIGYACCAFIILMFINALARLIWGFIRIFQVCYDQVVGRKLEVQSQQQIGPLQYLDLLRANNNNTDVFNQVETARQLNDRRRPSIDTKI